jgi:LCP family protein required for cell wall assembly
VNQRLDPERQHTWPQRLLIVFNSGLVLLSLTVTAVFGYFYVQFGRLPHISLPAGILSHTGSSSDPQNFLLVGSDSRAFVEGTADRRSFGANTGPPRADTIMLVRIDPRSHHAWVVSFPRDLWVPIAPDGHMQRINTAYSAGAQALIETIKRNFNVPIHHYAEVTFRGLQQVVDAVGGVKIFLPSPVRDWDTTAVPHRNQTGLLILDTGCVLLHGDQALAYVRSRHFEYRQANGQWVPQPGDLERNARQQDFVRRALRAALSKGFTNPVRINRLTNAATGNLRVSGSLNLSELVKLGRNFRSLSADAMSQYALPVKDARVNGAAVLKISDQQKADEILAAFRDPTPAPAASKPASVTPQSVNLRVRNGSGVAGQAGAATDGLTKLGFTALTPGDTTRTTNTTVRYGPGQEAKAALVASYLGAQPVLQSDATLKGVDVEVITGTDFKGVLAAPRAAAPASTTTSTTAAPLPPPKTPDC